MEILDCIGNTPLVRLPNDFTLAEATVLLKLEEYNLGGSVKSRIGYQMVIDAEQDGRIDINHPEKVTILEATGGNTGIGIAQLCALRGYRCILAVPDNYSKIRVNLLRDMGAQVVLSDHTIGNDSHIRKAREILENNPVFIYLDQFANPSNVKAHYLGTGQEIIQSHKEIDYFVAGIGSGGTISGVGRALKERFPNCKIIGIQPEGCDVLNGLAIPHIIQGIAIGQIPKVLDKTLIDEIISVNEKDVLNMKLRISKTLGLYLGFSSIANILGAMSIAIDVSKDKTIVTISPDGGRNYSS